MWMYIYPSLPRVRHVPHSPYNYMGSLADKWSRPRTASPPRSHRRRREVVRRPAARRDRRRLHLRHDQEVRERPDRQLGRQREVPEVDHGAGRAHGRREYDKPSGTSLFDLGLTPILPPQVWQQYDTGDGKGIKTFQNVPENGQPLVSGGPFEMTKYAKNDIALLQRNPNWYGTPAKIDGFGLQFYRDEDAMVTALKTGQLDAINEIPPTSVQTLQDAGMKVFVGQALSIVTSSSTPIRTRPTIGSC